MHIFLLIRPAIRAAKSLGYAGAKLGLGLSRRSGNFRGGFGNRFCGAEEALTWLASLAPALHLAAEDDRVAGVACLGTPVDLDAMVKDPERLIERCVRTGVIQTPGYPIAPDTWAKELSLLRPKGDAEMLKGRPLLVVHGADDPDTSIDGARALSEAASGPSDLHAIFGAGHWLRADPRVIAILVGWLERHR